MSQEPVITQFPNAQTVAEFIDNIIAFNWGSAGLHSLSFSGANGFVTTPVADPGGEGGATDWQLSGREDGSGDLMIGIEPMGTLTGAGGTGGAPANASPAFNENTILASQIAANWGANSLFWMVQTNNMWAVIVTNDNITPTFFVDLLILGKIYFPGDPQRAGKIANARAGRMGLGYLIGLPDAITTSSIANSMWGTIARSRVLCSIDFDGSLAATAAEWERPGGFLPASNINADLQVPTETVLQAGVNDAGASSQTLGLLTYIFTDTTTEQTGSRWPESGAGNQAYLYLSDVSNSAIRQLFIWLEGQSPF